MLSDDVVFAAVDGRNTKKHQREKDKVIATIEAAIERIEK